MTLNIYKCLTFVDGIVTHFKVFTKTVEDALKDKQEEILDLERKRAELQEQMSSPSVLEKSSEEINQAKKEEDFLQDLKEFSEDSEDNDYERNLKQYKEFFEEELEYLESETESNSGMIQDIRDNLEVLNRLETKEPPNISPDLDMPSYFDDVD